MICGDYGIRSDAVSICEVAIASFSCLANAGCTGKLSANSICFVRISFVRCASWVILVDAALLQVPILYVTHHCGAECLAYYLIIMKVSDPSAKI